MTRSTYRRALHVALSALLLAAAFTTVVLPQAGAARAQRSAPDAIAVSAASRSDATSWGRAEAPDQDIRRGCRDYRFDYRMDVPGEAWMAEVYLISPRHRRLGYAQFSSDIAPDRGHGTWRVCDTHLVAGRFTVKMKLTSYDARDSSERWMRPTTFQLG